MRRLHLPVLSKILLALLAWGWDKTSGIKQKTKNQCLPDSDPITDLFSILPLVFFESCWPISSCWPLLLFPGSLHDFLLSIPWPSSVFTSSPTSYTDFLALALWRLSLVPLDWRWLLFCSPKVPSEVGGLCPSAHSLIHSTNIYALSRGWKFKRI